MSTTISPPEKRPGDEGEKNGGDAEDNLMVGEEKPERGPHGDEPQPRGVRDVAHDGDEEDQRADDGKDVVADVAALVEKRRRDQKEGLGGERAPATEMAVAAQQNR